MDEAATDDDRTRQYAPEDEPMRAARARSSAADDVPSPAVGALLAWCARGIAARTAVEVGSAAGVSGLWLLRGLEPRGVLTSVEPDAHRHGLAVQAYGEAGMTDRVRAIEGDPVAVLPRLADGAYDLVVLQDATLDPGHLDHALRLVRLGGLVVVRGDIDEDARSVVRGLIGDDEPTLHDRLADDDRLDPVALPLDTGLTIARRQESEQDMQDTPPTT